MNSDQNLERVQQIRATLEDRDSEDLLDIWRTNDREEWSPETFEAIREILIARNASIPPQNEPPQPGQASAPGGLEPAAGPESGSAAPAEEFETYSDKQTLFTIASRAKTISSFFIGLFILIVLANVVLFLQASSSLGSLVQGLTLMLFSLALPLLICGFFWVVLQAIGEGIYLLMDIEENTRQGMISPSKTAK